MNCIQGSQPLLESGESKPIELQWCTGQVAQRVKSRTPTDHCFQNSRLTGQVAHSSGRGLFREFGYGNRRREAKTVEKAMGWGKEKTKVKENARNTLFWHSIFNLGGGKLIISRILWLTGQVAHRIKSRIFEIFFRNGSSRARDLTRASLYPSIWPWFNHDGRSFVGILLIHSFLRRVALPSPPRPSMFSGEPSSGTCKPSLVFFLWSDEHEIRIELFAGQWVVAKGYKMYSIRIQNRRDADTNRHVLRFRRHLRENQIDQNGNNIAPDSTIMLFCEFFRIWLNGDSLKEGENHPKTVQVGSISIARKSCNELKRVYTIIEIVIPSASRAFRNYLAC